jgi:hypothetical protein
MPQVGAKK